MSVTSKPPAVLTIAGTDSSGGAGIQADIKTFTALKCYGASVVTALTAQNTVGVQGIHSAPPEFVKQQVAALALCQDRYAEYFMSGQIDSVLSDVKIDAIKTGMLVDADTVRITARTLRGHYAKSIIPPIVCDPVCVSTSGHSLLNPDGVDAMIDDMFPLSHVITPNKSEAELLLSRRKLSSKIENLGDMLRAAKDLLTLKCHAVLLKGGHIILSMEDVEHISSDGSIQIVRDGLLSDNMEILQVGGMENSPSQQLVVDVLCETNNPVTTLYLRPRLDSSSTHGTGCTLSASVACELARGRTLREATRLAAVYTHLGIETAFPIGSGYGPLNHLHSIMPLQIPPRTPSCPHPFTMLLIQGSAEIWKEYVQHEFVKLLGAGTLPRQCFIHFIKQDYHYLKYYARAYGLLAAKSASYTSISSSAQTILSIVHESSMHKSFCAQWGITELELEQTPESPATTAYGAYIIDMGLQGDSMRLVLALAACLLGYGEVGLWLKKESLMADSWVRLDGNPYLKWIDDYSGPDYQKAVKLGIEIIEERAATDPPSAGRYEEWRTVWEKCTHLEKGFWDMSLKLQ